MSAETLDELFAENHSLPTMPKVVRDLIDVLRNENVPLSEVARKIDVDQVLTAKMLRLANSPYYGFRRKIATVEDAIRMLGLSSIRTLVISANLTGTFKGIPNVDLPIFWRHSLRVASTARHIAGEVTGVDPNLAFTLGCMHAIGHLIMSIAAPALMKRVNAQCPLDSMSRFVAEEAAFGYHFGDVSAQLAQRWDFSEEFVVGLSGFARPMEVEVFDPLAGVIHLAAWRVALDRMGPATYDDFEAWPREVGAALGVAQATIRQMPSPAELATDLEVMIA
jgi:HD-like signal output (HDOD) protein